MISNLIDIVAQLCDPKNNCINTIIHNDYNYEIMYLLDAISEMIELIITECEIDNNVILKNFDELAKYVEISNGKFDNPDKIALILRKFDLPIEIFKLECETQNNLNNNFCVLKIFEDYLLKLENFL